MQSSVQSEQQLNTREKVVKNQNKKHSRKKDLTQKSNGSRLDVIRVQILRSSQLFNSFYLRPHFNQKEKRSRRFRRAEFRQVGNGDEIEPNGSTH